MKYESACVFMLVEGLQPCLAPHGTLSLRDILEFGVGEAKATINCTTGRTVSFKLQMLHLITIAIV